METEILGYDLKGQPIKLVIQNGRFASVESNPTLDKTLGIQTIMPSFIDAHCHITITGMDLTSLSLAGCENHAEVLDRIRDYEKNLEPESWLLAVEYNQNLLAEKAHITREQIDSVCPNRPVLLRHVSWHAGVANSLALERANIREDVKNLKSGEFIRDANGKLNGVVTEDAYKLITKAVPAPTVSQLADAIVAAGKAMASVGVSCATDMWIGRYGLEHELKAFALAYQRGMPIRTRLALDWAQVVGSRMVEKGKLDELVSALDSDWCKVWGLKIFADGAIGAATAAMYQPYKTADTLGILMVEPEKLKAMVKTGTEAGYPVAIHSIGDRATDAVLDAFEESGDPARHRLEHAMVCSDAQIERIAKLGCHVTMQPEFLVRMGTTYLNQLGEERATNLKRARTFMEKGIPLSFNSDRPIVSGDPWVGVQAAVQRPEGYSQDENVSWEQALDAYTRMGAVANNDAGVMGELKEGQLADFLVLSENPVEIQGRPTQQQIYVGGKKWEG